MTTATKHTPNTGMLLAPVPYGATKFEVMRDANMETRNPARRVATFDTLAAAEEYVHAVNAYPLCVAALREVARREFNPSNNGGRWNEGFKTGWDSALNGVYRDTAALLRELGENE